MLDVTGPTILYVDDEDGNCLVFSEMFGNRFTVKTVGSGQQALEVLANEEVAVLITDQRMPGMSGNELLETTRDWFPAVVRVVITAYSDLDPILRAVNNGLVARYIVKPWARAEVQEMLRWALDAYRLGRESSETQIRLLATERLVTLGSISASIIHDINQPLSFVSANAERLVQLACVCAPLGRLIAAHGDGLTAIERQAFAELDAELPVLATEILTGCQAIKAISSTARRLFAPPKDQSDPSSDPWPSIRFALSACRGVALGLPHGLSYRGPETFSPVLFGSVELIQVVVNLITNAIHAAKSGEPPGTQVVVECDENDGMYFRCKVIDDGPGMSPETLENAGKAFFTTRDGGTGLGLYQCKRLVEGGGGSLTITSEFHVGTTVAFALRLAPKNSQNVCRVEDGE